MRAYARKGYRKTDPRALFALVAGAAAGRGGAPPPRARAAGCNAKPPPARWREGVGGARAAGG